MAMWAGIPTALAALGSGAMTYYSTAKANKQNMALAQRQMDFQQMMSSTAYQRAMQDMRQAGINPILAYSQGGASTPSGSTAQVQPELASSVQSALAISRMHADIENVRAQTALTKAKTQWEQFKGILPSLANSAIGGSSESPSGRIGSFLWWIFKTLGEQLNKED